MVWLVLATLLQNANPSIRQIDRGAMSPVTAARQVAVHSSADFTKLWNEHAPSRPVPAVDFTREMVVAIFLGSRPTAGFAVEIVTTREEGGALVVEYLEKRPGRDMVAAQVLTSPFQIVAVPARDGDVRFEKVAR